jgi:NAD(P)H-dependent FMN reductase
MIRLVALAGSLRRGSYNRSLIRALAERAPPGCAIEIADIAGIPLYDADLEAAEGLPARVVTLKDELAAADGWVLASPEYNNSLPGVAKNAVDWLSRPPADIGRVFGDLPVMLTGATPGGFGTTFAQTAWLPVLRTLRTRPWFGETLYVSRAHQAFDEDGTLKDDGLGARLADSLARFVDHLATHPRRR